jgi:outer membrane protein
MRRFVLFLMCGCFTFFMGQEAFGAGATKIAVVDIQKFQKRSKSFQVASTKLRKKFEATQKRLEDERNILLKLEEEFKKQSMMLSLDAQEDKKRELEKKRRYYKYLVEDLSDEMKDMEAEATKQIGKELEKVVQKLAEKDGYTLILEKRTLGLIYYNDAIDITDRVVEAYDASKAKE